MRIQMLRPLLGLVIAGSAMAQDWIIPAGTTVVYDTANGRVAVDQLIIEQGAILRIVGSQPFGVTARAGVLIDGSLDMSGTSSAGVTGLNSTNLPELGASGMAGGGSGGVGSAMTSQSTPSGGAGFGSLMAPNSGGSGGETGYGLGTRDNRRGAGGGGGALAADAPVHANPDDPSNQGRIAEGGRNGTPTGLGAVSQLVLPQGGAQGTSVFTDGIANNDFWGMKLEPGIGLIMGELSFPVAGQGGGAGGDAVRSATFPLMPFTTYGDEKGSGGGGGSGLAFILTRQFVLGSGGNIMANGGEGGGGENTVFFDRVGGGSGGGSGGYLIIESYSFDLSAASDGALRALGGKGGEGRNNLFDDIGGGGNGGPGVIQLHTLDGTANAIQLPAGKTLADLSWPTAHVLMPNF